MSQALENLMQELLEHLDWLEYFPSAEDWERSAKQLNQAYHQYRIDLHRKKQHDNQETNQQTIRPDTSHVRQLDSIIELHCGSNERGRLSS